MKVVVLFLFFPLYMFAQQRIPKEFLPLPKIGEGSIKNPYWKEPAWKVWALDSSPVKIEEGELKGEYSPLEEGKRLFPELVQKENGQFEFKLSRKEANGTSGLWDDVYLSQDAYHTRLNPHKNQYLVAGKTKGFEKFDLRHKLGVNFTSQSYARRGRHIVDDFMSCLDVERNYFFANTVRSSPSHISFRDNSKDAVEDTYDALYAHSYQSIGQSGSEMHAIYKMMYAAAFIPREVKNKLKQNGLYAPAVLNLFKAALPYSNIAGKPLPFEHEMRHKVAYSSHGTPQHPHYCSANPHFHGYNDNLHLAEMVKLAKNMKTPPPLTVLGLGGFAVVKNGQQVKDPKELQSHLKMLTVTNLNIWGKPGEIIAVRVNLNKSYDLNDEKLTYVGKALYHNQKNVSVKEVASGIFDIQVVHDPKLPKGRIPVIFTSQNESGLKGNPVFVNFYWPEAGELPDYHHFAEIEKRLQPEYKKRGLSKKKVTVNKRPLLKFPFPGNTIFSKPGEEVKFKLAATDPEGKDVTIYRRSGEVGVIENGEFKFTVPNQGYKRLYKVHLHLSDGTGGYTGKMFQIAVVDRENRLDENWQLSYFQDSKVSMPMIMGNVKQLGNKFNFTGQSVPDKGFQALFVSQQSKNAFDITLRSEEIENFGLQFSSGLDHYSSQSRLFFSKGKFHHYIRKDEAPWGIRTYKSDNSEVQKVKYIRMISDGKSVASYFSEDGVSWWQICGQDLPLSHFYAGFLNRTTGRCEIVNSQKPLPMIISKEKIGRNNTYDKLTLTLKSNLKDVAIHYTVDGSEPTANSNKYEKAIEIKDPGIHTVRVAIIENGKVVSRVSAIYEIRKK